MQFTTHKTIKWDDMIRDGNLSSFCACISKRPWNCLICCVPERRMTLDSYLLPLFLNMIRAEIHSVLQKREVLSLANSFFVEELTRHHLHPFGRSRSRTTNNKRQQREIERNDKMKTILEHPSTRILLPSAAAQR